MTTKTDNEKQFPTIYQRRMYAKKLMAKQKFNESYSASAYQTVSIGDILMLVRGAHSEAGIILETNSFESYEILDVVGNLNKQLKIHRAIVPFTWINPDNPEDRCETKIEASVLGSMTDDKYVSKLYTSALKILYRIEYNISGSKDDDIDMGLDADTANTKPSLSIRNVSGDEEKQLSKVSVIIKPSEGIEIEETKPKVSSNKLKVSKKEEN